MALARRPLFPGMVHSLSLGPTAAAALQAPRDAGRPYVALFLRKEAAEEHEAAELFTPSDLDECLDTVHGTGAFAQVHNVAEGSVGQSQALLLVHRRVDASTVVDAGPPPRLGVEHWPREAWIDEGDSPSTYEDGKKKKRTRRAAISCERCRTRSWRPSGNSCSSILSIGNTCSTLRSGSTSRTRSSWCARGVPSCGSRRTHVHRTCRGSFEFEAVPRARRGVSRGDAASSMASSRDSAAATPSS